MFYLSVNAKSLQVQSYKYALYASSVCEWQKQSDRFSPISMHSMPKLICSYMYFIYLQKFISGWKSFDTKIMMTVNVLYSASTGILIFQFVVSLL